MLEAIYTVQSGRAFPIAGSLALVLLSSCSGQGSDSGNAESDAAVHRDAQSSETWAPAPPELEPSPLPSDFQCEPTLESVRENIFAVACGFDTCHGDNDAAWGLRLSVDIDVVRAGLVGVPAGICRDWLLVAPGDPESSFLLEKLRTSEPACGEPMPRGYEPLPPEALSCISEWIASLQTDAAAN